MEKQENTAHGMKADVTVIGAGLTGLTTAYWLCRQGIGVHVVETRDRIGGQIETRHKDELKVKDYKMKRYLLSALAVATLLPSHAVTEPSAADSSRVYDLDEVVVVSQSKEYLKLRQQPLSSTVLTGRELTSLGIRDVRELSDYVPSFVMPSYGARFTSSIYVRGIGSRVNSPSMGVYIDDIPLMNKSAFNSHTWQLDRVDVLRGPQGTLYGINTEGGLVRQYTKNPMHYQGTEVNVGIGSRFYRNVEATHYQKLSDRLAFSVGAFYNGTNGFWKNSLTGERADDMDEAGGRLRLVWQPTERLSVNWMADYQYVRQKAYPYGVLNPDNGDVLTSPNQDTQGKYKRNLFNTGLGIKYQACGFDFHSSTSYQLLKDNLLLDNDYSNIDFIVVDQYQLSNALTQEFTFKGTRQSFWHWTSGLFGSYSWLKTTAPNQFGKDFATVMQSQIKGQMLAAMMKQGMTAEQAEAAIAARGGVAIDMALRIPCLFHTPQFNLGIFHESSFDITGHLTATIGLRYDFTRAKVEYDTRGLGSAYFNIMGAQAKSDNIYIDYISDASTTFNQLLPKFGLTYKFNDGSNIYATVAKGYRAGGFNIQMFGDIVQTDLQQAVGMLQQGAMTSAPQMYEQDITIQHHDAACDDVTEAIKFKPEESWNFELGTHLNLFDNLMHADVSAFYMKIRNQQLSVFTTDYGFGRKMVNADNSYSCGLEVSLRGSALSDHLSWAATYGYTRAVFKDYKFQASKTADEVDCDGNRLPYAPAHTLSAMADYRFDFAQSLVKSLTVGANLYGAGDIYWNELNTYRQKFYAVLGAHVAADLGLCRVNLWTRNLTNASYSTFAFSNRATGQEVFMAQQGQPFQMGVDVGFRF